jgi:hypothetical protein
MLTTSSSSKLRVEQVESIFGAAFDSRSVLDAGSALSAVNVEPRPVLIEKVAG